MHSDSIDRWYLETTAWFRLRGFFQRYAELPPGELAARAKQDVIRWWDEPFPAQNESDPQLADIYLLATDSERVWQSDLECVYPGENAYVLFLEDMARISRGAFDPRDIGEYWSSTRGPASVRMTIKGRRLEFLHQSGDMLNTAILALINEAIRDAGTSFEISDKLGMPNFIVALTRRERADLISRGWRFCS